MGSIDASNLSTIRENKHAHYNRCRPEYVHIEAPIESFIVCITATNDSEFHTSFTHRNANHSNQKTTLGFARDRKIAFVHSSTPYRTLNSLNAFRMFHWNCVCVCESVNTRLQWIRMDLVSLVRYARGQDEIQNRFQQAATAAASNSTCIHCVEICVEPYCGYFYGI